MESNKDVIRRVPEVINSKKHRSLKRWQHKQLKTVCGVNSPQMSDCATFSCAEKNKIQTRRKHLFCRYHIWKGFPTSENKKNCTELRETNAILVCTLQAHSFRYTHFIVVVLGVYSTKKRWGLTSFQSKQH